MSRIRRILLVTGSRRATRIRHADMVDQVLSDWNPDLIIHGCCEGFDTICDEWATLRGLAVTRFKASSAAKARYGGMAFTMRNTDMVEHLRDTYCELHFGIDSDPYIQVWRARERFTVGCVAFPGGDGTNDCAGKYKTYYDLSYPDRQLEFIDLRGESM